MRLWTVLPGQEGWLRHEEKATFLSGADGVVDQEFSDGKIYHPAARVFPSCPGGQIVSRYTSLRIISD
jgi:hypothetical protein